MPQWQEKTLHLRLGLRLGVQVDLGKNASSVLAMRLYEAFFGLPGSSSLRIPNAWFDVYCVVSVHLGQRRCKEAAAATTWLPWTELRPPGSGPPSCSQELSKQREEGDPTGRNLGQGSQPNLLDSIAARFAADCEALVRLQMDVSSTFLNSRIAMTRKPEAPLESFPISLEVAHRLKRSLAKSSRLIANLGLRVR